MMDTLPLFSCVLRPKRVTETLHQGASDWYKIRPHVTVDPVDNMAVVTVLISWRCNYKAVGLP